MSLILVKNFSFVNEFVNVFHSAEHDEYFFTQGELARALGYKNVDKLRGLIARHEDELKEFIYEFSGFDTPPPQNGGYPLISNDSIKWNENNLGKAKYISEQGVYLICMFSKQPKAKEFRRAVALLLKQLRKQYIASEISKAQQQIDLTAWLPFFEKYLSEECKQLIATVTAEKALGIKLPRPVLEGPRWLTPTEIAENLGVSANFIGRVISSLNIRGDERYSKCVLNKARNSEKTVTSYIYNEQAILLIEQAVKERLKTI